MPRRSTSESSPPPAEVDLNQVVAYNVARARQLRGWTQEEFADRLEPYLGQRLTQASVSAIERASDGERRRREFDAHEVLFFAMTFDLPIIWFFLPPAGDHRLMRNTTRQVDELYEWVLGRPDQLEPLYSRLRDLGISDPSGAEEAVERISGQHAEPRKWSYRERRKELMLAMLDQHADDFDRAIDELGRMVDHLRQVGVRGFIMETTNDPDFGYPARNTDHSAPDNTADETASAGTAHQPAPSPATSKASRARKRAPKR